MRSIPLWCSVRISSSQNAFRDITDFLEKHVIFGPRMTFFTYDDLSFNPRPDGVVVVRTPLRFFEDSEKRRRTAPPFFGYLISHPFHTFPENVVHWSSQVRSPGQVKWPYFLKSLWCYCTYSFWAINMKLSGYHKAISSYKTYILFFFRWSKVRVGFHQFQVPGYCVMSWNLNLVKPDLGQFCNLPIVRQWEKAKSLL